MALGILAICLGLAVYFDVVERRIPNWLVVTTVVLGLAGAMSISGGVGLIGGALRVLIGLALWLPLYAARMLGAGDVKLFAASSAWLSSVSQVLIAAAASAIVGGILAIVWALFQRRAVSAIGNTLTMIRFRFRIPFERQSHKLPYGVAMAIGLLWSFTRV